MDDFWLMVQQENSDTIVMLCNCVEMHKEKSAKYWPEEVGDTLLLGENREGVDLEVKGFICQPWLLLSSTYQPQQTFELICRGGIWLMMQCCITSGEAGQ